MMHQRTVELVVGDKTGQMHALHLETWYPGRGVSFIFDGVTAKFREACTQSCCTGQALVHLWLSKLEAGKAA